jgi:quercetin dioxygenase-like cupin family protein
MSKELSMPAVLRPCVLVLALCSACSNTPGKGDRSATPALVAFEDAKFAAVSPGRSGSPEIAVLRGDPRTGPSAMFIRIKKGAVPMHVHVSSYQMLVLKGLLKRWNEQQAETDVKPLGPGSYLFEPADQPHANSCLTDECVLFLVWEGRQSTRNVELRKQ